MKTYLRIIGIILTCLIACATSGCGSDEEEEISEVSVELRSASLPSGSTISIDTDLSFKFDGVPKNLTVNEGKVTTSGNTANVSGPFKPGQLKLVLIWEDGTESFEYTVDGALFNSANPSPNSTLRAYQSITVTFDGKPKDVTVNIGQLALSGNKATITGNFQPGTLNLVIKWQDGTKTLRYSVSDDPAAKIENIWTDYNVVEDGVLGMRIHVKFRVANMRDKKGLLIAYFYFADGNALRDFNGKFKTVNGNVSASETFNPRYLFSIYDDYEIFMPYRELHMARGKHKLKYYVQASVYHNGAWRSMRPESDWTHFTYTEK